MTEPAITFPASDLIGSLLPKKRILLVDTFATKRDLRASVMRKLGIEVDCAADISEARSLWRADSYNLVLMNVGSELGNREEFCSEIRSAKPPQKIAFLVGKPEYLAASPGAGDGVAVPDPANHSLWGEMVARLFDNACDKLPQRWGILEACWRISAVRSLKDPRSKAAPEKPKSSSWAEAVKRHSQPSTTAIETLPDLQREEIS